MAIQFFQADSTANVQGAEPSWVYWSCTDTMEQVSAAGFINRSVMPLFGTPFKAGDGVMALCSDGLSLWQITVNAQGIYTLVTPQNLNPSVDGISGSFTNANVTFVDGIATAASDGVAGNLPFTTITTDTTLVPNHGYFVNSLSRVDLTLPTTFSVSDEIIIVGVLNTHWRIIQNAGQSIKSGNSSSTNGATGYVDSLGVDGTTNCRSATFVGRTANTVLEVEGYLDWLAFN